MAQLQQEAFAEVACANAGGLELLNAMEHGLDLVEFDVQLRVERVADFLQRLVQVPLVVDAVDEGHGNQPIGIGHRRQVKLPEQMALEALACGCTSGEIPFVIVIAGQAACTGLVDVFPSGIDRQLVGYAFAPFTFFEIVDGRRAAFERGFLDIGCGFLLDIVGQRIAVIEIFAFFLALKHRIGFQRFLDLLLEIQS